MNKESTIGFGISLLTGIIVGGVVAMLYAPKSGQETRRMLVKKTTEAIDAVKEKSSVVMDSVKDVAHEANRKGHAAVYAIRN